VTATKNIALPGRPVRGSASGRPIMAALDLMGRRGTLRILWELREGKTSTFRSLAAASELPPGTLNARIKELREAALMTSETGYRLTEAGLALVAALQPLIAWSEDWARGLVET
jgi:DNA-binding HxlR family transcriptional regulator